MLPEFHVMGQNSKVPKFQRMGKIEYSGAQAFLRVYTSIVFKYLQSVIIQREVFVCFNPKDVLDDFVCSKGNIYISKRCRQKNKD